MKILKTLKFLSFGSDKVSVIIPAYNEAKTLEHVIGEALKLHEIAELILVNDGSTDDTEKRIKHFLKEPRFIYIKHAQNRGKGTALKTGISKAKREIILLLDADLRNITSHKIKKIIQPVIDDEVDVSRASFQRSRGRVTEYAAKPMMKILFPDIYFEQPISGQICAKKNFLNSIDLENRYGVDIGILFDAIQTGQRIVEVDVGRLEHKANNEATITEMAQEVLETMIKKAGFIQHKYNLILFALDDTIIGKEGFTWFFKKLKIDQKIQRNKQLFENVKISRKQYFQRTAALFKGMDQRKVEEIAERMPLVKYSQEVFNALKKRKYKVAIISSNFSPMVVPIAKRLGVDLVRCIYLESKNNILNGEISLASKKIWLTDNNEMSSDSAFTAILRKAKVKAAQTIIVAHNEKFLPLFNKAGFSIAYKPISLKLKEIADKTITLPAEILAIIE